MRLSGRLIQVVLVFSLIFAAVGWFVLNSYRANFEKQVQDTEIQRGGLALKLVVSRALEREWGSLLAVADGQGDATVAELQTMADTVPLTSGRVAWVGVVSPLGQVVAGTDKQEIGTDVTTALWFRQALSAPTMGPVYQAHAGQQLAEFFNLAAPIKSAGGEVEGVLVYRIRMGWLRDYFAQSARALGLDAFITDQAGSILAQATTFSAAPPTGAALQAARLSLLQGYTPVDTKEKGFVSASIPNVAGTMLPDNGWNLIVRTPNRLPVAVAHAAWQTAELALGVVVSVIAVLMAAAIWLFARPIEEMTESLMRMARGEMVYPTEHRSSREASNLSVAAALLQTRLDDRRAGSAAGLLRRASIRRAPHQAEPQGALVMVEEAFPPERETEKTAQF